jgi:hypothetical protein
MADAPSTVTGVTSQYAAQVAQDLDRNAQEQERVTADITSLQEQLTVLRSDESVLRSIQQAIGTTDAQAAVVPAPRRTARVSEGKTRSTRRPATKAARTPKAVKARTADAAPAKDSANVTDSADSTARKKSPAVKAAASTAKATTAAKTTKASAKATTKAATAGKGASGAPKGGTEAKSTLVGLVRAHLAREQKPLSAAEVTSALAESQPARDIKATVVRTTLENLVARSHAQRTKQGSSVFYATTPAASVSATTGPAEAEAPAAEEKPQS